MAKELWREGLPSTKSMLEQTIRTEFMKVLNWFIGLQHDYKINTGKMSKYIKRYLTSEDWDSFEKTYPDLNEENIWTSLFIMCDIFRGKAIIVEDYFGYKYPIRDDTCVMTYLEHIKQLPKNAKSIY